MNIVFILAVAILVAVIVAGVAMFLRRSAEGGRRQVPEDAGGGAVTVTPSENSWRDKFLFPLLVSVASGVVVAIVLYLVGIK
jgi:zinc transporter ZupT